jgi:hypothetical protein
MNELHAAFIRKTLNDAAERDPWQWRDFSKMILEQVDWDGPSVETATGDKTSVNYLGLDGRERQITRYTAAWSVAGSVSEKLLSGE